MNIERWLIPIGTRQVRADWLEEVSKGSPCIEVLGNNGRKPLVVTIRTSYKDGRICGYSVRRFFKNALTRTQCHPKDNRQFTNEPRRLT